MTQLNGGLSLRHIPAHPIPAPRICVWLLSGFAVMGLRNCPPLRIRNSDGTA
ncbi:hypothetical protein HKCCD6035_00705 [Rhodobacterales bacterium HKCCD6035]|nr:hypothetical protein [Rhodobacterales bacterium HKCCD6035]